MRNLLKEVNDEKRILMNKEIHYFEKNKLEKISNDYDEILELGYQENEAVKYMDKENKDNELNLIKRLEKYKTNHLLFANNFNVEFTNNTSERGLRQVKRKIAVSFMFKNIDRLKDYVNILSYIKTCYRHGISRYKSLEILAATNPYTISELSQI